MQITYQERIGPDGDPLAVPVMTDEQADELSAHLAEGVTPAGVAR